MQKAADLDLPFLPMGEDHFAADPLTPFANARMQHPWLARWPLGYVVTDYQAMRDLFAKEDRMSMMYDGIVELMNAAGTPWGDFQQRHMLSMPASGEQHRRIREVLAASFTPRQANRHRPLMQETIAELLDEWAPKRAFDFEEFASYFPITVMCKLIGADPAVIPGLRSAMEAIGLSTSMDKRWLEAMQEGVVTMETFVEDLIAQRRAHPRGDASPDLLDLLLGTREHGGLTEQELIDVLIFLFVAGYDTSKNMLTLTMNLLLDRPEIYRRCGQDHDYARRVVEESFRFHSTTSSQRVLCEDLVYRDVVLEKDAIIWFPLSVALHDGRYAENPGTFDPDRERRHKHIGFGLGPHMCLGQYIARAQIHEGLHLIARRLSEPRRTGSSGYRPFPGTWGLRGLPIAFNLVSDAAQEGNPAIQAMRAG